MMKKNVHCYGVMVFDVLCGPISHYPVPKVQAQITAERVAFQAGGGAANTSAALAQLGVPIAVFSKVGHDMAGDFILQELRRHGVDVTGVIQSPHEATPFTFVGIHPDGDRSFVHVPGANRTAKVSEFDRLQQLDADFLLYQDFWVMPESDGAPAAALLRKARKRGVVTLLDECWGLGPNATTLELVLPHVDFFLPSADDIRAIYPGLGPAEMGALLRSKGARCVILKLGPAGCLVCDGNPPHAVPSHVTNIVDTTGAGDCFDAGFIAGLMHGLSPRDAAVVGSRTAAKCIASIGGANGIPKFEKLRK